MQEVVVVGGGCSGSGEGGAAAQGGASAGARGCHSASCPSPGQGGGNEKRLATVFMEVVLGIGEMIDFYCFENTDKTNHFDSDWGTRQKRYKNKNIIIITSKESRVDHHNDD